jgi:hypothetical protein
MVEEPVELAHVRPQVTLIGFPVDCLVDVVGQSLDFANLAVKFPVLRGAAGVGVHLVVQVTGLTLELDRESMEVFARLPVGLARRRE